MTATLELNTLFEAFAHIKDDRFAVNNIACRLLNQWQARFSCEDRAVAWAQLDRIKLGGVGVGVFEWLLQAGERNEVAFGLEDIANPYFNTVTDDMLQTLMRRVCTDAAQGVTAEWKDTVGRLHHSIAHALQNNDNISNASVTALLNTRVVLDECDHNWSVRIHHHFPANILRQMEEDPNNQSRVTQQKLAEEITHVCSNRYNIRNHFKKFERFFEQICEHSLRDQQNPNGVLYDTIKLLCQNMPAPVLKEALGFLLNNEWSPLSLWGLLDHNTLVRECHNHNYEYIDLASSVATPQQQAQLFTWVLEGIAYYFFKGIDHKNTTLSSRVETVLQKPYAQHKPFPITIQTIHPYLSHVKNILEKQPEFQNYKKTIPNGSMEQHYISVEKYYSTLETYLQHTTAHFHSDDTLKAVKLLQTIDSPSLRGVLDFWGRLHDVDYQLNGLKTMEPLIISESSSILDKALNKKILDVQHYINISGSVDASGLARTPAKKM